MADRKKDNPGHEYPGHITNVLCDAYRENLKTEIVDLKSDMKRIEDRTWQILAGIGVSIILTLLNIAMNY